MNKIDKYNNLTELTGNKLDQYNFANLFNVIQLGEKSYFNICKTLNFDNINNIPDNYIYNYVVTDKDSWTTISYKFYDTVKLWWLICKINNIIDPFNDLIIGSNIKILKKEIALQILSLLRK